VPQVVFAPPEVLEPKTPREQFTSSTLYKKINGSAELYLEADFVHLDCQRFQLKGRPDDWLEVFVYDMGQPENALAVLSSQLNDAAERLELADHSYRDGGLIAFKHGQYYVRIVSATQQPELLTAAESLAENFIAENAVSQSREADTALLFPAENMIPDSIGFRKANVFGCRQLDNVYLAKYRIDDVEATAFLSERNDSEQARELAESYAKLFLEDYGATHADVNLPVNQSALQIEDLGYTYFIFHRGRFVGGVHECRGLQTALKLGRLLYDSLKQEAE